MITRSTFLSAAAAIAFFAVSGCHGTDSVTRIAVERPLVRPASGGPGSNLVWVLNNQYKASSLTGFQVTDNGDVAPTQIITGDATQLVNPWGVFKTAGTLFVTEDQFNNFFTTSILMFPVSSNGNVAPSAFIGGSNTGLYLPIGITVSTKAAVIVSDWGRVLTFAPGTFGNVSPMRVISGPNTQLNADEQSGIAVHNGLLYVISATPYPQLTPEILVFHEKDNGNVAPLRVIVGPNTGLAGPKGIRVDKLGDVYVSNANQPEFNSSVTEYAPTANGDASPIATLQGPQTFLNYAVDLTLDNQSSRVYVVNIFAPSLTGYALPITGNEAPFMDVQGGNSQITWPVSVAY